VKVLLVAMGPTIPGDGLVAGVQALQRNGSHVELVSRRPASEALAAVLDGVHPLPSGPAAPGAGAAALTTLLSRLPGPARKLRFDPDRLAGALRLNRDAATRSLVRTADVVVAVDQAAVPAVWWAARRRPSLIALNGVPAAVTRLTAGA